MNKSIINGALIIAFGASFSVQAGDNGLEKCIADIQAQKSGDLVKLEKLNVKGKAVYEIELKDANGFEWEYMCDANSGKIFETESEVSSPNSLAFKSKMKVTEEDAKATALKAYPGVVEEVEYEVEANGDTSYEFDIVDSKGVETKVEVDAATGKITEVAIEEWEIGEEADERR
ncbi:PepSY domain-containing protein [methane-oxidizing endosymbiont of Gigantopelta aegis]|uniref:PepSY domain-containing protein n=1 Tax=methane-oxidizing endosymbiont of Gigantopelta aegis TaxID=2794938 RepID=UPI0018DD97D9|nr:PepSY domain-containing protein [methane-oxidizing endosymbiont of Gigantopelta aegis]